MPFCLGIARTRGCLLGSVFRASRTFRKSVFRFLQDALSLCSWVIAAFFLRGPPFGTTGHILGVRPATKRLTNSFDRFSVLAHDNVLQEYLLPHTPAPVDDA